MSVLRIKKGTRFLKRCIALCAVLALVLAAPIAAGAGAVNEVTAQEMKDALNALSRELSAAAETLEAQDDTLDDCREQVTGAVEKIDARQQSYLREDLLEYVELFTSCMRKSADLQSAASAMENEIASCTALGQEVQQSLTDAVQASAASDSPFGELKNNLEAAEQWTSGISREGADAWLAALSVAEQTQSRYHALTALLPGWAEAKQTLDRIEDILGGSDAQADALQALCDEKNTIVERMKQYPAESDENQNALLEQMETFRGRMDAALAECLAENVQESRTQALAQEDLTNRVGDLEGMLLLLYIALGVAAVSLVLGIAALAVGMNKSRVKALERQTLEAEQERRSDTENLYGNQDKLNRRIEQLSQDMVRPSTAERDIAELKRVVENMRREYAAAGKPGAAAPERAARPVGKLHLNYNAVAPELSLLQQTETGEYVLYSDDTVEPAEMPQTNTAGGWVRSGLCCLFELEWNGLVVRPAELGESFYEITDVLKRATVTGRKKVAEKGMLSIRKIS